MQFSEFEARHSVFVPYDCIGGCGIDRLEVGPRLAPLAYFFGNTFAAFREDRINPFTGYCISERDAQTERHPAVVNVLSLGIASEASALGSLADVLATGFRGSKGFELTNAPYQAVRNSATTIEGRQYSGRALDQMQNRGFMPSVVANAIETGTPFGTRAGTTGSFDAVNNVRVITDTTSGGVVTVIPGGP